MDLLLLAGEPLGVGGDGGGGVEGVWAGVQGFGEAVMSVQVLQELLISDISDVGEIDSINKLFCEGK